MTEGDRFNSAFVVIVDLPFEGETSIGPDAIKKTLTIDAHRT